MTREELTKVLKDWKPELELMAKYNDNSIDYQRYSALEKAIKALSAEPCEDCISRQQAINKMQELENEDIEAYGCSIPEGFDGKRAIEALKTLPSVQPISKFVIEDIKADIAEFMSEIPALGNCKEGWHNAGQRIGREQACEIIDNHIAESEDKE